MGPENIRFSPTHLITLIGMVKKDTINGTVTKTAFKEMFRHDVDPEAYVEEKGLKVIGDEGALRRTVGAVMAAGPQSMKGYRSGKEKTMGFLVEQTIKVMEGGVDPTTVNQLVRELLDGGDA